MRRALLSVVVGSAGVAAVAAAAYGLQVVTLVEPAPAARIAADAEAWLHNYPLSIDVFHVDGHRLTGACLRGWFLSPQPHNRRPSRPNQPHKGARPLFGSVLALSGGPVVFVSYKLGVTHLLGRKRTDPFASLAVAVGCTGSLANVLTKAIQSNDQLSVERDYAANQPALALSLPRAHRPAAELYVSAHGYRPLVAIATRWRETVTARLYLAPMTETWKATFRRILRLNGAAPS